MNRGGRRSLAPILTGLALLLAPAVSAQDNTTCEASASWVTSPSQPDFNTDPPTFCSFYQYAWQSFLYLTSPAPGAGGALVFETMDSVTDVVAPALAEKRTTNVPADPALFLDRRQNRLRRFEARDAKEDEEDFSHTQAGPGGVLVDQNGNVTYYEQFLDPIAQRFIDSCFLDVTACQALPVAANLRFPPGAIELKVSWRPLESYDPSKNSYYVLKNVTVNNPQTGKKQTYPYFALVGFHLVYTTPQHPELVWMTFEHVANAPDGPCTGPTTPPPGYSGWAFNNATQADCSNVNAWTKGTEPPYPVTQAFRNWAYGTDPAKNARNIGLITNINKSILGILPADSVWRNYFLVGGVWTNSTGLPAVYGKNIVASAYLANVTMETFTQTTNPLTGNVQNCFNCHNAETTSTNPPNPPPFKVSHAFAGNTGDCPYSTTLPPACAATQSGGGQGTAKTAAGGGAASVEPVSSHGQR